jgi:gamma-glutamyltranspeptidase/glutathione hydrolase
MVVSAHRLASEVGRDILRRGGNAVDAAVAVGFALAVVYPEAGNLGGGGFMLVRRPDGSSAVIDFREMAPARASRTMYLDSLGNVTDKSFDGALAAGVPGTVAGFAEAIRRYGTMPLRELVEPSLDLARGGFVVDRRLDTALTGCWSKLSAFPSTVRVFSRNGARLREGDTLRQPDLARTLTRIRDFGVDGFYRGETSRLLENEMHRDGGIITKTDLEGYHPVVRTPLRGFYRGLEILSPPPPSSGGLCLLEILNIWEGFDLGSMGFHSSRAVHVMAEAMKRAFADRAELMGDPDFTRIPDDTLVSKEYSARRRNEIDTLRASASDRVRSGAGQAREGRHTTHYCVVDREGTIATTTYTLNDIFGCKVVVDSAGFFLNDEMDDFSAKPGVPNAYGLVGGDANAISGHKRPLSSMLPTIVLKSGRPIMVLGARGGSKIITAVAQVISNVADFNMDLQEAVDAPRFHHQWLPDTLVAEKFALPRDVTERLEEKGQHVREADGPIGALEAIWFDIPGGWIYGVSDPREGGDAEGD